MSAVFRCRLADGGSAVLKASPDRARLAHEAAALERWHTRHTPAVLAFDKHLGALLIEGIEPGTPLVVSSYVPAPESIAELMRALHESGVRDPSYPTVEQRVTHLFDSSAVLYEWHPELATAVPRELYERGRQLATRLAREATPTVLLHGDLTPSNILDGGGRGLVAIDPAPCLGDGAFDAVDLILWQADTGATITARTEQLAEASGLSTDRLRAWCVAFAAMTALELGSKQAATHVPHAPLLDLASDA
jgi:streptomycin 6-kinase